jgi:endonuclease III
MINPTQVYFYDAPLEQLEEFLLFAVCVAGKTAKTQAKALHNFLNLVNIESPLHDSPFARVKLMIEYGILKECLIKSKMGQYGKLEKAYTQIINSNLDLHSCNAEELEKIHGIGFKTSRFFLIYTRRNVEYAALDTHILRYLRDELHLDAPKSTPGNYRAYRKYEKIFIEHAQKLNRAIPDLDLEIWKKYSKS